MKRFYRSSQGGSAVVFTLVSIALVIGLVALVYVVKVRGNQVRKDQAIATYEQQKTKDDSTETKKVSNNNDNNSDNSNTLDNSTVSNSDELPDTGLDFKLINLIAVGFIPAVILAYILSRRDLAHYL